MAQFHSRITSHLSSCLPSYAVPRWQTLVLCTYVTGSQYQPPLHNLTNSRGAEVRLTYTHPDRFATSPFPGNDPGFSDIRLRASSFTIDTYPVSRCAAAAGFVSLHM
jgi:hypothetical protein